MMNPTEAMNSIAHAWAVFMLDRTVGSTLVFLLVYAVALILRKRIAPQWGYLLFLIVFLKLVAPVQLYAPLSWDRSAPVRPAEASVREHVEKSQGEFFVPSAPDFVRNVDTNEKLEKIEDRAIVSTQPSPAPTPIKWKALISPLLLVAWFAIVLGLSIRLAFCQRKIRRMIRLTSPLSSKSLPLSFQRLLREAGVNRPVSLMTAEWVYSPFVVGIFRPSIVVPSHFGETYSPQEIRWVLMHELSHIRRWDPLVKWLQTLIQIVFFYHPVVWIANRFVDKFREFACDDDAVRGAESSRYECGAGFLRVALANNQPVSLLPGTVTLFHSKKLIKERLMRILNERHSFHHKQSLFMALLVGALILLALPFGVISSQAQAPSQEDSPPIISPVDPIANPAPAPLTNENVNIDTKIDLKFDTKFDTKFDLKFDEKFDCDFDFDFDFDFDIEPIEIAMTDFDMDMGTPPYRGLWTADIKENRLQLNHAFKTSNGRSNFGESYKEYRKTFNGLSNIDGESNVEDVTFTLGAQAGKITYTGDFMEGLGSGRFTFEPNDRFIQEIKKRDYIEDVTPHQLFIFTTHDFRLQTLDRLSELGYNDLTYEQLMKVCLFNVTPEFIMDLRELGFSDVPFKQLVTLQIHNVSRDFIADFQKAGYKDLQLDDYTKLRIHNVSLEFAKEMADIGYPNLSIKELVNLRIGNVSPKFIKELSELGYEGLPIKTYQKMGLHKATPEYVREMQKAGFKDIDADKLVQMRIHNVTPEYMQSMTDAGYGDLSIDEYVSARIHNVKPEVADEIEKMGYGRPTLDLLKQYCIHKVGVDYIKSFNQLGYRDVPLQKFIEMKIHKVSPDTVEEMKEMGYENPSVNRLIEMRIHKVNPEFIEKENEKAGEKLTVKELVKRRIMGR